MTLIELAALEKLMEAGYAWCPCHRIWNLYPCAEMRR